MTNEQDGNVFDLSVVGRKLEAIYPDLEDAAKRLGQFGWTLPLNLDLSALEELAKLNDKILIDDWLTDYYTANDNKEINEIFKILKDTSYLRPRIKLLEECIDNFRVKNYFVSVPALVSLLEGAILTRYKLLKSNDIWVKEKTEKELNEHKEDGPKRLILISINSFTQKLFKKSPFEDDEPELINRHWILHGRSELNYKISDNIRLYNALNIILED